MKLVVNKCYGGFGLSPEGAEYYLSLIGKSAYFYEVTIDSKIGLRYQKVNIDKVSSLLFSISTKDFGDEPNDLGEGYFYDHYLKRDDPNLIKTVEDLGKRAGGRCSNLRVVEIPDGVDWTIEEYDGREWIAEKHRTW